jgi:demethylmenaquinone methyltransferase/2-methoxy-6-polyprenyl-1,4-benzoquinol methylase
LILKDIYDPAFVEELFGSMSATYERMNLVTSFGFSLRWRRQCVEAANLPQGITVVDLMSGMGEAWEYILRETEGKAHIIGVDFCQAMLEFAKRRQTALAGSSIQIRCENALNTSLPDGSADAIISTFGLKTFSQDQLAALAAEAWRILKPGGVISMVEISQPNSVLLSIPYLFYLKIVIPALGKLFLGNPENYRMLGIYTEQFGDCSKAIPPLEKLGFEVKLTSFFFGCATGFVAIKPA